MTIHMRRVGLRTCATVMFWLAASGVALADPPSKEIWPEVDTWLRLSSACRLSLFLSFSENLDTHDREGSIVPQVDFEFGKARFQRRLVDKERAEDMKFFLVRGGYLGGKSLDDDGQEYTENTAFGEFHQRIPVKGGLLVSHRLRSELRWLGSISHDFSTRWRYRVMVEKELTAGRASIVPYANAEAYYDTRYDTLNRWRLIAGASVAWASRTAIEINTAYQNDSRASPKDILALGVIVHLFFDASRTH